MRLQDHIDFPALEGVKPELDETLALARDALEAYVDNPGNRDAMRSCADSLHQVHGTLRMVELYGAAMVAEEMETLAISLLEDHVAQREDAYAALMRGLMQLPDYLERLSSGHRDVPVVLLPLLNDLRSSRGQQALHESALFSPNLESPLPPEAPGAASKEIADHKRGEIAELRVRFQQQLLAWFRGQSEGGLAGMRQMLEAISARCHSIPGRRLWWIASGVLEGLQQGVLKQQASEVRQLIGKVDRSIRQLIEQGEGNMRGGDADELARKLLYVVAQSKQRTPQMTLLAKTYALDALLPDASELEHARGSMSGHNRALLDSVSRALKDDLLRVKEALDLFLRQANADPAQLSSQIDILERVGDTLGMLALGVPRRVVNEQRRVLDEIANRMRTPDEEILLDVAGALLYVEASLDDHIESLGAEDDQASDSNTAMLPRSEARHILATLMHEAIANTSKVKESIVAFVESGWQHQELTESSPLMDEVAGALRMLSAPRPAELAEGIGRFIGNELLSDRRVPSSVQMDHLADALAALEYYLEAAREHRGGLEHILDVAEHSLSRLGYWPPPAARAPVEEAPLDLAATPVGTTLDFSGQPELSETVSVADGVDPTRLFIGTQEALPSTQHDISGMRLADTEHLGASDAHAQDDGDWMEIEEEIFEQVPVSGALAFNAGFQASTEGIDDEIREIFLEEMQEEIDNLYSAQKQWLADVTQRDALTSIRRSFHTLKGSGRLVGASLLGEFGWKVENMLNRVLDASIEPHEGVQELVRHAIDALPPLLQALKDDQQPTAPLAAIMETADRLAGGSENARISDFVAGPTETVRRVVRRRVPRLDSAADAVPSATLAEVERTPTEPVFEPVPDAYAAPVLPPVDPVLLEILRSEVAQYLQTIRNTINRVDGEIKVDDGLLRAVHTLHGAIAMVDIPLLTQLLSPLESLLKRLRAAGQPLSIEGVSLLARSADAVDYVMGQFDTANPQLQELDALIARIIDLRDSQPEPQVAHVLFEPQEDELEQHETEAREAAPPTETPAAAPSPEDEHHNAYAAELLAALDAFELDAANEAELDTPAPIVKTGHGDEEDDFAALFGDLIEEHTGEPSADGASHEHAPTEADEVESFAVAPVEIEPVLTDIPLEPESVDNVTHTFVPEVIQEVSELPLIEEESALTDSAELVSLHEALQQADETRAYESLVDGSLTEEALPAAPHESEPVAEAIPAIDADAEAELLREIEAAEAQFAAEAPVALPVTEPVVEPVVEHAVVELAHVAEAPTAEVAEEVPAANESNAAMVYGQIDPDLLEIFIEEGREILDHADGVLEQWRAEPTELEHVASLQRDLHTLKGGARIAGMLAVGDLTHAIETLLEKPVGQHALQASELISALEGGFDQLHLLVQRVSQGRPIEYPQAMIDRFLELSGETSVEEAVPPPAIAPLRGDLPELLPEEGQDEESRGPQEQIRVRAELLDSLVNHAGEVAIYRSRLEQQVAGYRFNLVELDQTVQRLCSQLRMLEIETEAQIIARFQREHREAGLSVFDPLELDRYSQLQQYSRALAESVSDLVSIQNMLDELTRQAETLLIQQSRVSSELQDGLLRTRMLPFDTMVPNLRRTLRQAAQDQGKGAQLYVEGAHGEMDRNLLDRIKAPFEHILRNAVAHGIETPAERRKAGKPEEGAVRIRVAREATEVVVRVTDDGRGLDREAIRKRGVERGLLRAEANPSDDQILQLITQTGFSTASEVTQLAGRGVGMDVVANEIKQLGGSLAIDSQQGKGTTFVLRLPFTLAVTQAILVRIGESNFAIPMTSVQGVARITPAELAVRMAEPNPTFEYGGEQYGIHDLSELLGLVPNHALDEVQLPLLLTRAGDLRAAIRIDAVIVSREIVVKSVGPQVSSVPGILGATIMGDGSVLVILDLAPLVRHGIVRREQRLSEGLSAIQTPVVEEIRAKPLIMVVDDSITMRKVTGRVLERHEYEVTTAKDGVDAVEKLHDRVPDLMLLDIEMPRMDGYELATHMKADPRLRNVPIIMIPSRTGDKHRQRAFDIGVDRYLGKPYQEAELLMQINEVLEQRAMAAVESIDE